MEWFPLTFSREPDRSKKIFLKNKNVNIPQIEHNII